MVKDTIVNEHSGSFTDWHLKLWGEAIDAAKTVLLPMPTEEDDEDHDKLDTTTAVASTTTLPPNPQTTVMPTANPTDHPDRPTKPTGNPADQGSATGDAPAASETHSSSWLPSFLANLSTKTQIWIYGALGLIVAFCAGLGVWLYLARRRRLRNNPRDDYEFELLDDEEAKGLNGGEKTFAGGRKGRKTRGGELYDAFAGGSDDDDDDFGSDGYHDRSADGGADDGDAAALDEKQGRRAAARGDEEDDDLHHVIGDDSDDEEQQDRTLLGRR